MTPFGQRLKNLRDEQGLSQNEIAKRLGIPSNTYGNYERDQREPDFETTRKISRLFAVSIDYLMGTTNDPTPYRPAEIPPSIEAAFRDVSWEELTDETQRDLAEYIRWKIALTKKK